MSLLSLPNHLSSYWFFWQKERLEEQQETDRGSEEAECGLLSDSVSSLAFSASLSERLAEPPAHLKLS